MKCLNIFQKSYITFVIKKNITPPLKKTITTKLSYFSSTNVEKYTCWNIPFLIDSYPLCSFISFSWFPFSVTFLKVVELWNPLKLPWHDKVGHIATFISCVGMRCCHWSQWNVVWVVRKEKDRRIYKLTLQSQDSFLAQVLFNSLLRTRIKIKAHLLNF